MDLEETAGQVATIAVDEAVVVPDCKTDCIHDIKAESASNEDIIAGVLGHITQGTVINVVLHAGILDLGTGCQSKVECRTGDYQEFDVFTDREMQVDVQWYGKIGLVE